MQKQIIKTLIVAPSHDAFDRIYDVLQQIEKWSFEARWERDFAAAISGANGSDHGIILMDAHLGQRFVSDFLTELENKACITPAVLLVSNPAHQEDFETAIAKPAGYLEKSTLDVYQLERSIRYVIALKRAADQVRESEMRLRGIFYGAAIGIALFGLEGQIVETNPALTKITGFSNEELCSLYLKDLFLHPTVSRVDILFSELVEGRRGFFQVEERFRRKNGRDLWIRLTVSHFKERNIPAKFAVGLLEDITERKQAEAEVRETWEQMRKLSRKILEAQENERKLVAQEIHDSIGGSLAAIKFALEEKLESMGKNPSSEVISLEKIISHVDEAISESRRISVNLRPSLLDDLGLLATISWFCREFRKLHPDLQIEQKLNVEEKEIPDMSKVVIYRVLQEAMNNVAKHSEATRVRLDLATQDNRIELFITDNGSGFDPEEKSAESTTTSGFGLLGMRDRTVLCDGKFDISSEKGKGTTVHISLPCDTKSRGE